MIEGHGDDLHRYEGKIKHNFSSNVHYHGVNSALKNMVGAQLDTIQNYPSPSASELNVLAAEWYSLSEDQFLFTNGATEAFYLIAHKFADKKAAILAPTFSEYQDACKIHGVNFDLVARDHSSFSGYDLAFICNPNNPDGEVIQVERLELIFKQNPATTFVIDEAYIEFTTAVSSVLSLVDKYDNLVVVRSLTKSFAIPGLRLGYVVSSSQTISGLIQLKMPWSVNTLAIHAGEEIFKNYDSWLPDMAELLRETSLFKDKLEELENVKVMPSSTSYFLLQLVKGKASELKEYLANEHGLLVRDASNFQGLDGEHIRLSTQSPSANELLINALKAW